MYIKEIERVDFINNDKFYLLKLRMKIFNNGNYEEFLFKRQISKTNDGITFSILFDIEGNDIDNEDVLYWIDSFFDDKLIGWFGE